MPSLVARGRDEWVILGRRDGVEAAAPLGLGDLHRNGEVRAYDERTKLFELRMDSGETQHIPKDLIKVIFSLLPK